MGEGKDIPGGYSRDDVTEAIRNHHAITTNAPFLDMKIGDAIIGDTTVISGGQAEVRIRVRAPSWAQVDKLIVYSNAGAIVATVPIPAGQGEDFETVVRLTLARDSWVVAEATGVERAEAGDVAGAVPMRDVVAVHADVADRPAGADPDEDLGWWATQEIPDLLA